MQKRTRVEGTMEKEREREREKEERERLSTSLHYVIGIGYMERETLALKRRIVRG